MSSTENKIYLVTGASRGIGLELVKQLAALPDTTVYAAMRKPFDIPTPNNNIISIQLEQASTASVTAAAAQIPELDSLFLNAAIGDNDHLLDMTDDRFLEYLNINVVGPNRVVKALLPALLARKTRRILILSSSAGSIAGQVGETWGLQGPYAVSKSAANMMAVQWHNELLKHTDAKFTVVPIHPGWVDTDMGRTGGGTGGMKTIDSALGLIKQEEELSSDKSAKFVDWEGKPWAW